MRWAYRLNLAVIICAGAAALLWLRPADAVELAPVDKGFVAKTTDFSFRLFHQVLAAEPGKNVFISPTSIATALSMTYNGADGGTKEGMAKALSLGGLSLDEVNKANLALLQALTARDEGLKLKIANSLWARKGFLFAAAFIKRNQQFYRAKVTTLDFASPEAVAVINSWVKDSTDGMIPKIVEELKPLDVLVLINAVCFKGIWAEKFDQALTKPGPFTLSTGAKLEAPMMRRRGSYAYFASTDLEAIGLPYAGGRMSMYVFLPKSASGLADFCKQLTPETWEAWLAKLHEAELEIVMPRFKVEYEVEDKLKDALTEMGMGAAFGMGADFRSMVASHQPDLFISRIAHKAFMEVNEEGTKAAAATSVTMTLKAVPGKPITMVVDHPFFCAIRDNKTGAILFMGAIEKPG